MTQMSVAKVRHAILTCYSKTFFLVRDEAHRDLIYISDAVGCEDMPVMLYYSAFFAMAAGLLPETMPRGPEIEKERSSTEVTFLIRVVSVCEFANRNIHSRRNAFGEIPNCGHTCREQ